MLCPYESNGDGARLKLAAATSKCDERSFAALRMTSERKSPGRIAYATAATASGSETRRYDGKVNGARLKLAATLRTGAAGSQDE